MPVDAPRWPSAPDPAQVVWVGDLTWPELVRPLDVSCGSGRLVVADPDGGAVWLVDLGRGRTHAARGPGAPRSPVGVAVDPRGGVWVADGERVTVQAAGTRRWAPLAARFGRATAVVPGDEPVVVDAAGHQARFPIEEHCRGGAAVRAQGDCVVLTLRRDAIDELIASGDDAGIAGRGLKLAGAVRVDQRRRPDREVPDHRRPTARCVHLSLIHISEPTRPY